jgi:hypothetical protein
MATKNTKKAIKIAAETMSPIQTLQPRISTGTLPTPFISEENGKKFVRGFFTVKGSTVEFDYVKTTDTDESYGKRFEAAIQSIREKGKNFTLDNNLTMFRLWESGNAVSLQVSSDDPKEAEEMKLISDLWDRILTETIEPLYDDLFVENGQMARKFTQEMIKEARNAMQQPSSSPLTVETLANELQSITKNEEANYLKHGDADHKIGWLLSNGDVLAISRPVPQEVRYRFGRAVAEVAQTVGAKALLLVFDGYNVNPKTHRRNGTEILQAMIITPDGKVSAAAAGNYKKVGKKIKVIHPVQARDEDHRVVQRIFPAWNVQATQARVGLVN